MPFTFKNPKLAEFIDEEVSAGHYPSAEDAIEAAVSHMMATEPLTDEEWAGIEESERQIERGEVVDFETFKAEMRSKFNLP
jgi:Arc/MetJ-type ribon-helix-helix transcriptional regulator